MEFIHNRSRLKMKSAATPATIKIIRLLASLFLGIGALFAFAVLNPNMPTEDLDPSWMLGLSEATAKGMEFGRDIIFTFGPYSGLYTQTYHPATDHLVLCASLYLAFGYWIASLVFLKEADLRLRYLFALVLGGLNYSVLVSARDAIFLSYSLIASLAAYRIIATANPEENHLSRISSYLQTAIVFSALSLLPLMKGNMLIPCIAAIALTVSIGLLRRRFILSVIALSSFLLSVLAFWTLAGQPVSALPDYFKNLSPMIAGYTEAMMTSGWQQEILAYAFASTLMLGLAVFHRGRSLAERAFLFTCFGLYLYLSFKGGYTRHDSAHAATPSTAVLLGALLLAALPEKQSDDRANGRLPVATMLAAAVFAWAVFAAHYAPDRSTALKSVYLNAARNYQEAVEGLKARLLPGNPLENKYRLAMERLKNKASIPLLKGSSDIYSHDQSYLIASGNTWSPRPIFQSYSVYTPELAQLNATHLLGEKAPENLLIRLQPIDHRLPALEDGASWPSFFSAYSFAGWIGNYAHLQRRDSAPAPTPRFLTRSPQQLDEWVRLPETKEALFAEIAIKQSPLGHLIAVAFKPSQLNIEIELANGQIERYRLVSEMAAAGFVMSPQIGTTEEFAQYLQAPEALHAKRVKAFRILDTGPAKLFWKTDFNLTLKALQQPQP